ncbi:MAG: hypothetical protein ABIZ80_00755 [Bryobacteraceae bacterium]
MKKILLVVLLLGAVFYFWRSSKPSGAPNNVRVESPTSLPPGGSPRAIPQAEAISGSSLNKAFPSSSGDYRLVFTQEKDGFASADLTKAGSKVATLTVSDTDANPGARDKFKASTHKIGGYPAAAVGSQGTAVLVAGRYQVQARSLAPSFTEADRQSWLERFKLAVLAEVRK